MKKMMFSLLTMSALLWLGCTQPADVDAMLQNEDSRAEIFAAIVEDDGMMTEFMNEMQNSEQAMMMMKGDENMMSGMMAGDGMMKMMQKDPAMMHNMMSGMMKDGKMMSHMLQMMNQQDMMSDECLQSCMKMMQDKGMSMDMGDMEMMEH